MPPQVLNVNCSAQAEIEDMKTVHQTAKGLLAAGAIDQLNMRKFDSLCNTRTLA